MTNDAWSWNGTSWTPRAGLPALPAGVPTLVANAMATDPASGGVLTFGGYSTSTQPVPNDTWRWDGWTWNRVASGGPPPRSLASLWSQGNLVYLFGGQGNAVWLNDTWAWNGTAWSTVTTSSSPPARRDTAVVYDAARGEAVLFSGRQQGAMTSDTWTFDGSTWRLRSPATNPPAREMHALAYDPVRSRAVMFGGAGLAGMGLDDTWEWDGTDWTQVLTTTRPPGSYTVGMAYDTQQNRIVMAQPTPLSVLDMWSYDGVDWAPLPLPVAQPLAAVPRLSGWPANRGRCCSMASTCTNWSPVPPRPRSTALRAALGRRWSGALRRASAMRPSASTWSAHRQARRCCWSARPRRRTCPSARVRCWWRRGRRRCSRWPARRAS